MKKKILLGIGTILLLIALFFIVFVIRLNLKLNTMTPIETGEIMDNIFSIQDSYANLFIVKDGESYIAVDGGIHSDIVSKELNKIGVDPDKIKAVFLTHSDSDHTAAIKLFKNAQIYLSPQEIQFQNGPKPRKYFFKSKIKTDGFSTISDGQTINIGNIKIKGILTPGHTPGMMCYQINDKYLFSGDLVCINNGHIEKFDEFFNMDDKMATKSIEIITTLPAVEFIFTAHFGYTNDFKYAVKDFNKKHN